MPVDLSTELRISYLRAAQAAQEEEESNIQTYRDFWDGDHDIELTSRQEEYLREDVDSFANLCKRVVNIPKERLEIKQDGVRAVGDISPYADAVTDWWTQNNLASTQKDIYEASLRDGSVAVIVGWDSERRIPTFTPNLVYDGATGLIRFHYDSDGDLLFASKRWTTWNPLSSGETGKRRLTVYRPDVIERYEAESGGWRFLAPQELGFPNPQPWTDDGTMSGEPLGIPVIPFENPGGSELADVITIQELLNHSLGTFDVAVDHHGFPLLWFANAEFPIDSATGKSEIPEFGPRQAINLRDGGEAGRIESADLMSMFQAGIISWVQVMALVKGWPMFLFDRNQQPPSGVALSIMEGGLVKQVKDKQAVFGGAWRDAFEMGRRLTRLQTRQELTGEIDFAWESAATADEQAEMERLETKFRIGEVPIIQRWRELGYTEDAIEQMLEDKQREDEFGLIFGEVEQ